MAEFEEKCKKNVVLLSRGICQLVRCKDQIRYSSRKDMNCRKMIKYVTKSFSERVEIKDNLNDKEFMISDVLPCLPDLSLHFYKRYKQ